MKFLQHENEKLCCNYLLCNQWSLSLFLSSVRIVCCCYALLSCCDWSITMQYAFLWQRSSQIHSIHSYSTHFHSIDWIKLNLRILIKSPNFQAVNLTLKYEWKSYQIALIWIKQINELKRNQVVRVMEDFNRCDCVHYIWWVKFAHGMFLPNSLIFSHHSKWVKNQINSNQLEY